MLAVALHRLKMINYPLLLLLQDCATLRDSSRAGDVEQSPGVGWIFLSSTFHSFSSPERRAAGSSLSPPDTQHGITHEEFGRWSRQIPPVLPPLPGEVDWAPEHAGLRGEAAAGRDSEVTARWHPWAEGQPLSHGAAGLGGLPGRGRLLFPALSVGLW